MSRTKKEQEEKFTDISEMTEINNSETSFEVDLNEDEQQVIVPVVAPVENEEQIPRHNETVPKQAFINCLKKQRVIVRFIPKKRGFITNPKHVLSGGMSNNAVRKFSLPKLASSGLYKNPLTNDEKEFLEYILNLEPNALSIYKKKDNFWDDSNENGISQVTLGKQDNILDLSNPTDYIKYKILLANDNVICPSLQELQDKPKATYQFYILNEEDEVKSARKDMSIMQQCYMAFGKIQEDKDTLKFVIEYITGKPIAASTKIEWMQAEANKLIQANNKIFLKTVTDKLLNTKVLINRAINAGIISYKGNQLYLREDNSPLCNYGEEPTFTVAAEFLNQPKNQQLLFTIQSKLK